MSEKLMIYGFLIQLIILYGIIIFSNRSFLEPIPIFGFSWILNALLLATNYLNFYHAVFTFDSFLFVTFGIWAFVVGANSVRFFWGQYKNFDIKHVDLSFLNSKIWIYLFEVFILIYIASIFVIYINRISFLLSFDLTVLREMHWANYNEGTSSLVEIVRAVARSFATIKLMSLPFAKYSRYKWRHVTWGVISAVFLFLETFLEGGRGLIVYMGLITLYLLLISQKRREFPVRSLVKKGNFKLLILGSFFLLLALYGFMVWFPKARNPLLVKNFDAYLSYVAQASLSPSAKHLAAVVSNDTILPFYFSASYFTTPIPTLTFFFENTDFTHWFYAGAYNFPLFIKPIELLTSQKASWLDIRYRIAGPLTTQGFADNPWATGFRDLVIDFGVGGSVIFLFIFGFLCQTVYMSSFRRPKIEMVFLMSQIVGIAAFFGFYSSFYLGFVMYPIIIIILIMIVRVRK